MWFWYLSPRHVAKIWILSLKVQNWRKEFQKFWFSSNYSEHVNQGLATLLKNDWPKSKNLPLKSLTSLMKENFLRKKTSNFSLGHVISVLTTLPKLWRRKLMSKMQSVFGQSPRLYTEIFFFGKKLFLDIYSSRTYRKELWQHCQNFFAKVLKIIFSESEKIYETNCSRKFLFVKVFLWTQGTQFLQSPREQFVKSQKNYAQSTKLWKLSKQLFFHEDYFWTRKFGFDNHVENCLPEVQKSYRKNWETFQKTSYSKKQFQKATLDT